MLNTLKSRSGKTNAVRILFFSFIIFFIAVSNVPAQDSSKNKTGKHKIEMKEEMRMDKGMKMDMNDMKDTTMQDNDSSITRTGVIDLRAIDKNKDGKVYQCKMDYDVLSDKPGKDPKCGMKLQKVSLEKAKAYLIKSGFKVK